MLQNNKIDKLAQLRIIKTQTSIHPLQPSNYSIQLSEAKNLLQCLNQNTRIKKNKQYKNKKNLTSLGSQTQKY